jgi:hypothetical protein
MTSEAKSYDAPDEKRHDAGILCDMPGMLLDWTRCADYAEPTG